MIDFRTIDEWHIGNDEVVKAYLNGTLVWDKDFKKIPFYVENIRSSNETLRIAQVNSNAPAITIEISTDCITWTTLGTTGATALTYTLTPGSRLYLRANATTWYDANTNGFNAITGVSRVGGNIMSLLYGSGFTGNEIIFPTGATYVFRRLFDESTRTPAWHLLKDASGLILPATTLVNYCYGAMFANCTALTNSPALPATTLANYCYGGMFNGCTSLTVAPALPATRMTDFCYAQMFYGCTSLATAPELLADWCDTTGGLGHCYYMMFSGCTSLNFIKCIAYNPSYNDSTLNWVSGVAATGTFVKRAGVTNWSIGNSGIPSGWTVIDA